MSTPFNSQAYNSFANLIGRGASATLTSEEQAALAALGGAIFDNAAFGTFLDSLDAALRLMGFVPV